MKEQLKKILLVLSPVTKKLNPYLETRNWHKLIPILVSLVLFIRILYNFTGSEYCISSYQKIVILFSFFAVIFVTIAYFLQLKEHKAWTIAKRVMAAILWIFVIFAVKENHIKHRYTSLDNTVHHWNVYHYYIGSKYFAELGYHDIYQQTLVADKEGPKLLANAKRSRNLGNYRKYHIQHNKLKRSPRFTDERWLEFKKDIHYFLTQHPYAWEDIIQDRGYNPTPFWNMVGSTLSNNLDITVPRQRIIIVHLDIMLGIIAALVTIWAFGIFNAALLFLSFTLLPFNKILGNFLKFDFFYFLVISISLYKKNKVIPAGIAISYSIMARIFPIIFVFALGVSSLYSFIKTKKFPQPQTRFLITVALACVVFFIMGGLHNPRGFKSWTAFAKNIELHNKHHIYGQRRVGLKHIFTQKIGYDRYESRKQNKEINLQKQFPLYAASAAVLILLFLLTVIRREDTDALIWGLPVMFALLVASRYYWSVIALVPLLYHKNALFKVYLTSIGVFLLTIGFTIYAISEQHVFARYLNVNSTLFFGFLIFMIFELLSNIPEIAESFNNNSTQQLDTGSGSDAQ